MNKPKLRYSYLITDEVRFQSFYLFPKYLMEGEVRDISFGAKIMFTLFLDRLKLSIMNGWVDQENHVYIIYKVEDLMKDIIASKPTVIKIMKELESRELIYKQKRGMNKPDFIYITNLTHLM